MRSLFPESYENQLVTRFKLLKIRLQTTINEIQFLLKTSIIEQL